MAPATMEGVLKMPAPMTMPTMMATAVAGLSLGVGEVKADVVWGVLAELAAWEPGAAAPVMGGCP